MKKISIIIAALIVSSCCTLEKALKHEKELCDYCLDKYVTDDSVTISFKIDTTITTDTLKLMGDSLLMELLLECDSNNNVIVKQGEEQSSEYQRLKYKLHNNKLSIKSYMDSIEVLNKKIQIEKEKVKTNHKTVEKIVEKCPARDILSSGTIGVGIGFVIALILVIVIKTKR